MKLRRTGRTSKPWNNPKLTTRKKILKKLEKTRDFDVARSTKARKVETPPLNTAGPMLEMV